MKRGFTLIELIFVITILSILSAVAVPKLLKVKAGQAAIVAKVDAVHEGTKDVYKPTHKAEAILAAPNDVVEEARQSEDTSLGVPYNYSGTGY